MSTHEDDLDLLLSLQDRVLETPPTSPSAQSSGYLPEDGSSKRKGPVDMSVFRNAVQDCLDYEPETSKKVLKPNHSKSSSDAEIEKFSGLRIRNQLVSRTELSDRFADIRFVRLPAIKNMLAGETLSGCWATVGVLCEKGETRTSSTGKPFCIWKIGCLDEKTVSVFLFGNVYQNNCKEEVGTVFALFNCSVRKDNSGGGFSLSVFSAAQMLKLGIAADYGLCKSCKQVINKLCGIYCNFHKQKTSEKYTSKRTEYKGGNLKTAFRDHLKVEGIYVVDPQPNRTNLTKSMQPKKLLSVEGLRKALSNAGKVTTNAHSQGIRFLTEVAGKLTPNFTNTGSAVPNQTKKSSDKRSSSMAGLNPPEVRTSQQVNAKRIKIEQGQTSAAKATQVREKMIELDLVSSDDEL